eukprot:CAMPEP_0113701698 /NCGR_PEP_ID=MMETSP0038_2-20120614/24732_1 /TAXON_ID=2898 /ORGANISM="Cryptomonas paramecium" /LENGTH=641 /DNA_ID=CAMNT_0000625645 /DNA_START=78 /DNA_END=1999 /DNA_ORIENTATION=+ /assembly_acc=CAM_ASM_000170
MDFGHFFESEDSGALTELTNDISQQLEQVDSPSAAQDSKSNASADSSSKQGAEESQHDKYCHFCQHVKAKASSMLCCSSKSCPRRFCENCLIKQLGEKCPQASDPQISSWKCPICRKSCCCAQTSCTQNHRHCKAYRYRQRRAENSVKKSQSLLDSSKSDSSNPGQFQAEPSPKFPSGALQQLADRQNSFSSCGSPNSPHVSQEQALSGQYTEGFASRSSPRKMQDISSLSSFSHSSPHLTKSASLDDSVLSRDDLYGPVHVQRVSADDSSLMIGQRKYGLSGANTAQSSVGSAQSEFPLVGRGGLNTAAHGPSSLTPCNIVDGLSSHWNGRTFDHLHRPPLETDTSQCPTSQMIQRAAELLSFRDSALQAPDALFSANRFCEGNLSFVDEQTELSRDVLSRDGSPTGYSSEASTSSLKRLTRTDSHEELSNQASHRVNASNLLYSKGRRWGGSCENLRRMTSGMSPCPSFENMSSLQPNQQYFGRTSSGAQNRFGESESWQDQFRQNGGPMSRSNSIDNLLASGVLNAAEGVEEFLAHSLSEIDLVSLGSSDADVPEQDMRAYSGLDHHTWQPAIAEEFPHLHAHAHMHGVGIHRRHSDSGIDFTNLSVDTPGSPSQPRPLARARPARDLGQLGHEHAVS